MAKIIKLPGLIDTHVHLREPGAEQKEDFESGTKAAIAGGYTTILDMPNNPLPTITEEALDDKLKRAEGRIYCDLGFHFGGTPDSSAYFDRIAKKAFALKIYMNHTTGTLLVDEESSLSTVFKAWPNNAGPIMVHAEDTTLDVAIRLAKQFGKRLHVCHVSLKDDIIRIKKAKEEGMNITCEVTCHHLFLTENDRMALGPFGIMKPPLGTAQDVQALWDNLDIIDTIASDHAPHTKDEKLNSPTPPFGVPGLETSLPLLVTAVADGRLTIEKLISLTSERPSQIFGIQQAQDTYIEIDMHDSYTINNAQLYTKCGWTPFDGFKAHGRLRNVVLRGESVFDGEQVIGPKGVVIKP